MMTVAAEWTPRLCLEQKQSDVLEGDSRFGKHTTAAVGMTGWHPGKREQPQ